MENFFFKNIFLELYLNGVNNVLNIFEIIIKRKDFAKKHFFQQTQVDSSPYVGGEDLSTH